MEGMNDLIGLKLKESVRDHAAKDEKNNRYYLLTRPDFYSSSMHVNMYIYFDDSLVITGFGGDKCYSSDRGLYNRSARVSKREFTKRDILFLRRVVYGIVEGR